MNSIGLTLLFAFQLIVCSAQTISKFDYSSCLGEMGVCEYTSAQIIEAKKNFKSYQANFTAYNNCIEDFEAEVIVLNDSILNLVIVVKGTLSQADEIEIALCDCLFEFDVEISNVNGSGIKELLINGESFDQHNDRYSISSTIIEDIVFEEIPIDPLDLDSIFDVPDKIAQLNIGFDSLTFLVNRYLDKFDDVKKFDRKIFVEFGIDRNGDPFHQALIKGNDLVVDSLINQYIQELDLTFSPAEIDGMPVATRIILPISIVKNQ